MATALYKARLKRLFKRLDGSADALLLQGDGPLLRWLTGTAEGMAVATKRGVTMVAHPMFAEACAGTGWPVVVLADKASGPKIIRRTLGGAREIGLRFGAIQHSQALSLRKELRGRTLVDVTEAVAAVSCKRDAAEIADLRRACRIAARAARAVPTMCTEGMTEIDLMAEISFHMANEGAIGGGMVAFGAHTSQPHVVTGRRRLRKGDFVMVDFGATVGGVGSDITRTFVFGKASAKQHALYAEVYRAQRLSFELIEKKKDVRAINAAVSKLFQADGYGPFVHSIGHGLGHFGGAFENRTGAVNTVEPGLYVPGFGGVRIEDDILMTAPGRYELLTAASPRSKLIEI
jgi:Xaa-Pro aminopeptidase